MNTAAFQAQPRGRRPKALPSGRRALLDAATRAFADVGFAGADLRSVAASAGVSPNLVRIHFGSKDELWNACVEESVINSAPVIALVRDIAADRSRPAAERMRAAIAEIAEYYVRHPDLRHFVGRHVSEPPERSAHLTDRLLRPAYESLRDLIVEAAALGVVRTSHPALFFALLNSALSQPASFPTLMDQLPPNLDPVVARQDLTQMVIDALVSDPD